MNTYIKQGKLTIVLEEAESTRALKIAQYQSMGLQTKIEDGLYKGKLKPQDYILETQRLLK